MAVIAGKKAVFFTFSALFLLAIIFTWMFFSTSQRIGDDSELIKFKTENLNEFVQGFDQDMQRGLYISGFRALLGASDYVSNNNSFIDNSAVRLAEAMVNGTFNGTPVSLMENSTLQEWLTRLKKKAEKVGIIINYSQARIVINQSDHWKVDFFANVSYNITDTTNTAVFRRNKVIMSQVSIIGLIDPIYTVYTMGQIVVAVNSTPYESKYASGQNTTNLKDHINRLLYANSTGPSYLMRLQGNLSNSSVGIESIVHLPDFQAHGLLIYERSSVDYIYFGNTTPTIYKINNTFEDWFRLDSAHLAKYQVAALSKT
jgi:hypothetical protein